MYLKNRIWWQGLNRLRRSGLVLMNIVVSLWAPPDVGNFLTSWRSVSLYLLREISYIKVQLCVEKTVWQVDIHMSVNNIKVTVEQNWGKNCVCQSCFNVSQGKGCGLILSWYLFFSFSLYGMYLTGMQWNQHFIMVIWPLLILLSKWSDTYSCVFIL